MGRYKMLPRESISHGSNGIFHGSNNWPLILFGLFMLFTLLWYSWYWRQKHKEHHRQLKRDIEAIHRMRERIRQIYFDSGTADDRELIFERAKEVYQIKKIIND